MQARRSKTDCQAVQLVHTTSHKGGARFERCEHNHWLGMHHASTYTAHCRPKVSIKRGAHLFSNWVKSQFATRSLMTSLPVLSRSFSTFSTNLQPAGCLGCFCSLDLFFFLLSFSLTVRVAFTTWSLRAHFSFPTRSLVSTRMVWMYLSFHLPVSCTTLGLW